MIVREDLSSNGKMFRHDFPEGGSSMIVKEDGDEEEPTHHQIMSFADQLNNLGNDHFTDEKPSYHEEEEDHCSNLSQMRMAFPDE